jgi:hypothetical protein
MVREIRVVGCAHAEMQRHRVSINENGRRATVLAVD